MIGTFFLFFESTINCDKGWIVIRVEWGAAHCSEVSISVP